MTAPSKQGFVQDYGALETKCNDGDEIYLKVMDGADQREKNAMRNQLRTAPDDKRKDRRGQDLKLGDGARMNKNLRNGSQTKPN